MEAPHIGASLALPSAGLGPPSDVKVANISD
jgi:hypothetical protein